MAKLTDLAGAYDNLSDEPGVLNHPHNILAVTISFMILTWITALFRLFTRFFIVKSPGWDDAFVILSLLSTSAGSISICLAVIYGGMGTHFLLLDETTVTAYLKIFYVANASYPLSAGFIKLALLFQYLRVYEKNSGFRMASIVTIVIVTMWSTIYGVMGWVPCVPVYAFWNMEMPATRYGFGSLFVDPFVTTYTSLTATNMILDMIILVLAAPLLLYNPQSNKRSRKALVLLFAFGSIASIFSILRLASIVDTTATTSPTFDPTWYGATPIVFAALEVDVATITAALPVFWPVLVNNMNHIMVTREVKVTMENRADTEDEAIELQRSKSGLQVHSNRTTDYYDDPYIAEQVNPFKGPQFGVKADVGADQTHSRRQRG